MTAVRETVSLFAMSIRNIVRRPSNIKMQTVERDVMGSKRSNNLFFKLFTGSSIALLSMGIVHSQDALGDGVMIEVSETVSLNASPTDVWSYIGDFDRLDSWHPVVASSETNQDGASRIRHLTLGDGSKIVERLDSHDDEARSYTYTIVDAGPLPVRNYQSTIKATQDGTNARVTWLSEFEAREVPEADAQAAISGVYTSGFAALVEKFGPGE